MCVGRCRAYLFFEDVEVVLLYACQLELVVFVLDLARLLVKHYFVSLFYEGGY